MVAGELALGCIGSAASKQERKADNEDGFNMHGSTLI
jgi:hypothetical protein